MDIHGSYKAHQNLQSFIRLAWLAWAAIVLQIKMTTFNFKVSEDLRICKMHFVPLLYLVAAKYREHKEKALQPTLGNLL